MMWIWLPTLVWVMLLLAWGRFWRADQVLPPTPDLAEWPDVAIVIPARNESPTIGQVVTAHLSSDYHGSFRLYVVDDGSEDGTGNIARSLGAEVISAPPLPDGWSGKLWALNAGLTVVQTDFAQATWVLLTDADIRHAPDTLRRLVAKGESERLDLVSLMASLDMRGLWGGLLIPAFVFFFQKLYPFSWVNTPGHWCAAAAGGCILVRREALAAMGGIGAIRGALIDDCTLAAGVKRSGHAIWLGLARHEAISMRDNQSFGSIWHMVTRTAFTQLRHSVFLLIGSVAGMALLYAAAPVLTIVGVVERDLQTFVAGTTAWALMSAAYWPTLRHYRRPKWQALTLPLAGVVYTAMTIGSAIRHWRGRGGQWKGRTYS